MIRTWVGGLRGGLGFSRFSVRGLGVRIEGSGFAAWGLGFGVV